MPLGTAHEVWHIHRMTMPALLIFVVRCLRKFHTGLQQAVHPCASTYPLLPLPPSTHLQVSAQPVVGSAVGLLTPGTLPTRHLAQQLVGSSTAAAGCIQCGCPEPQHLGTGSPAVHT